MQADDFGNVTYQGFAGLDDNGMIGGRSDDKKSKTTTASPSPSEAEPGTSKPGGPKFYSFNKKTQERREAQAEQTSGSAANVSSTDLLLAGIGTAGLVAESRSGIILSSRSGLNSGKLSMYSPRVYSKANAGIVSGTAKGIGWGLTIWSIINTEMQFAKDGNSNRRVYNHMNNGVGILVPVMGLPMAAGDYFGQKYSNEIVKDISQPGGFAFEGMKAVLEFLGIPTSPDK